MEKVLNQEQVSLGWAKYVHAHVNYRAQKLNKYSLTRKYLLQKQNIIKRSATCIITML